MNTRIPDNELPKSEQSDLIVAVRKGDKNGRMVDVPESGWLIRNGWLQFHNVLIALNEIVSIMVYSKTTNKGNGLTIQTSASRLDFDMDRQMVFRLIAELAAAKRK